MPLAPSAISDFGFRISDFPSTLWTISDLGFRIWDFSPASAAAGGFGFRISDLTAVLCGKDCFEVSDEKGGGVQAWNVVLC